VADVYEHWQEAERLIAVAEISDWYMEGPYVDRIIAMAQVHATLAIGRRVE
jgi:hypothetical protein